MKKQFSGLEYAALIFVIAASIALLIKIKNSELDFCKGIFGGLVRGRFRVEKLIDWENLNALEQDIGADYRSLPDDNERLAFRRAFIRSFSLGFLSQNARLRDFINWRIHSRGANKVTVAADHIGKNKTIMQTVLWTISLYPQKKLISLKAYPVADNK